MKFNFTNVLLSLIVLYGLIWLFLGLMRTIRHEQVGFYKNTKGEEKAFTAYWSSFDNKYWHFESNQGDTIITENKVLKDSVGMMSMKVNLND